MKLRSGDRVRYLQDFGTVILVDHECPLPERVTVQFDDGFILHVREDGTISGTNFKVIVVEHAPGHDHKTQMYF